ncbi:hypothetical protein DPSP01_008241 [Paraphaeosphaeria sporulosa]|uniref:N-acetyltransferase domain-containing protein n=1 Tax=Paraphaeosphaeria sporulosa TaxID=1460663 RepID=A0A177BVZ6_9PLEO|nr:uncharacterized protein CC84DRAFT_1210539 [Paraphaeosphaeria sporulosa]OAF99110.1 hypothetical protein CC84DRAFT_1210539 [Paraphaeosphaeria sporulosa]
MENRKLSVPSGWQAPARLQYKHLTATILNEEDVQEDLVAVNSSRDLIRRTRGGSWPATELTLDENLHDLKWHAQEARDNSSFAYAIRNTQGEYVGCFYLYPFGMKTKWTEELGGYDVDANWWVTTEAYSKGDYEVLYQGLKGWMEKELAAVGRTWWSNAEIPA